MDQEDKRKLTLPLSFTTVLTIVFLAVGAMTGAYVWGVMSGRSDTAAPAAGRADSASGQSPQTAEPAAAPGRILKAQELEFASVLKGEGKAPPKKQEQPKQTPKTPAPQPREPAKPAPAAATGTGGEPSAEVPAPQNPHPGGIYDYTFQVAALRDEQAVDTLRQNLEGRGLRTRMERSGKVFLVLVLLRGDESRANDLLAIVREMRLGEPLLRGKKAVP